MTENMVLGLHQEDPHLSGLLLSLSESSAFAETHVFSSNTTASSAKLITVIRTVPNDTPQPEFLRHPTKYMVHAKVQNVGGKHTPDAPQS